MKKAPGKKVQLEAIPVKPGMTKGDVAALFHLNDHAVNKRSAILLDLYFNCLAYANKNAFTPEKTSTLLAIVKAVHTKAVGELMTIENSFAFFKTLALQSSVHRPPYSMGIFSFAEMKEMTEYMLGTYYRHYKLYQYAYTDLVRLDVELPAPVLETPPGFAELSLAYPEAEWNEKQAALANAAGEAKAKEEEEKAAAEEAEREARLKAEYDAAIPEEVSAKVEAVLAASLAEMKEALETKFAQQEESLLAKIAKLEAK